MLRAILWRRTGDMREATRLAGICGMLIAAILIIFGVYMAIAPNVPFVFHGLLVGAGRTVSFRRGLQRRETRAGAFAEHRQRSDVGAVLNRAGSVDQSLDRLRLAHAPPGRFSRRAEPATARHVGLEDLKTLPRERWHLTRARDVMRPIAPRFFVEPNATLDYARELMKRNGIGSVAVVGKIRRTGRIPAKR